MQYLILLLALGATLEYYRRERTHRRVIDYIRVYHAVKPAGTAPFRSWWPITLLVVALLVFSLALALELTSTRALLNALGVALLPVAGLLVLIARQELARSRSERMKG